MRSQQLQATQQIDTTQTEISQFHANCADSESVAKMNHSALFFCSAISMVIIKFGKDGHMFWLKFECKSVCIDEAAFIVVEVTVNGFDLVKQDLMALAPTVIVPEL